MSDTEAFWDRYWRSGALHSCVGSFAGNYEGAIRDAWEALFSELSDGAVVVDICTGNGAVAALAAEHAASRGARFEVHGIDLADIDPLATVADPSAGLRNVRFHPRTAADALPFGDGTVDAVIGQYALEYTPVRETLVECARVLRPGGAARFVVHHPASVILSTGEEELNHAALLFDQLEIFRLARALLTTRAKAGNDAARQALARDPVAEGRRRAFNRAASVVSRTIESSRHPEFLQHALGLLGQAFDRVDASTPEQVEAMVDQAEADLTANRERLQDLVDAAVDGPAMDALLAAAAEAGLRARRPELLRHDPATLMGWLLDLERPSA